MKFAPILCALGFTCSLCPAALAQHLWWDLGGEKDGKCLYGEVAVYATNPTTYFCGANWHPGEAAGGYCGIQHNSASEKRTIFSIWDTSPNLHPETTFADKDTIHGRFGGEGEGGHTHMVWPWLLGDTFRFFVAKHLGKQPDTTDCDYFVFENEARLWLHSATITSPNGGKPSVATIGGSIASFLENFSGRERDVAKFATYNLWLGVDRGHMKRLVKAGGDGKWGRTADAYFLAEGSQANLEEVLKSLPVKVGEVTWAKKDVGFNPLPPKPIDAVALPLPQ